MRRRAAIALALAGATACNPNPLDDEGNVYWLETVDYRTGLDGTNSGERGTVKISEIGWAGSLACPEGQSTCSRSEATWDRRDVFLEVRNESNRPMMLNGWRILREGTQEWTWRIRGQEEPIGVGDYLVIAAKRDGCFPNADVFIEDGTFFFGWGDAFRLTLKDADERLIEPAGNKYDPPYAGIYDGQVVRTMEKAELMFGGRGSDPESWHHYTNADVDVPNNDRIAERCRHRTLGSPGRPNSPDYSGAFSAGATD